jgi:hypothetical protein
MVTQEPGGCAGTACQKVNTHRYATTIQRGSNHHSHAEPCRSVQQKSAANAAAPVMMCTSDLHMAQSGIRSPVQVQRHEIPQIVEAICELNNCETQDCDIPITYMVVSKGHHTRLFPATPRDSDRNGNVLPGKRPNTTIFL